jgi:pimeloyl-ACP methyl ester carboxylesterase
MTDAFSYQDTGGGGSAVLFLHGNLSRGSHWAPQPESLGDELRCIARDQRGFGRSTGGPLPIEFETRVDSVVPKYDDPVICSYDLSKFGASTVIYALRTHLVVIIGGFLHENPFYVDPDQLLRELREQRSHVGSDITS